MMFTDHYVKDQIVKAIEAAHGGNL
jgi:hypothetical protein